MENNKIAVGLDIGTTKDCCHDWSKNEYGKIEVLGIGKAKSLGVKRGVVNNITQTILIHSTGCSRSRKCFRTKNRTMLVVGIAGQHIRSIQASQ